MTSIRREVNDLPTQGVTTYALQALDFVIPGEWHNVVKFDEMVTDITGETDPNQVQAIVQKTRKIYGDKEQGYQQALWVYKNVDRADQALAATAMANKIGNKIGFLSFLTRLTPKPDTLQSVDLGVKVVAELVAFAQMEGLPRNTSAIPEFTSKLSETYRSESLMRMVALVCLDGLIPLGPDFTTKVSSTLGGLSPSQLESNALYKRFGEFIPGGTIAGQLGFINDSFASVQGWMDNLLGSRNINVDDVLDSLKQYIDIADDKLDYVAAFLDVTTNYYTVTGTQTVARKVIEQANS
ncbi:MAG: hypothetical protein AAF485_31520 [Chloroflexota bacterium]